MADIITYIGPDGTVAMYDGPQSDDIEADPHTDIGRVHFHSALPYIAATEVIEGSVTLEATGYDAVAKRVHNIHAHGRPYTPLVFGMALNLQGYPYEGGLRTPPGLATGPAPFSGTLMLGAYVPWPGATYGRGRHKNLQLGANATHVTITDVQPYLTGTEPAGPQDSFSYVLQYRIAISNFALPV